MRICVFGAGAVGGHFAARLAAAGHDVSVVARGAQLEAYRTRGATLLHGEEVIAGRVRTDPAGPQEAIIVALKANALGAFAAAAAPLMDAGTAVVFAQNGIPWWHAPPLPALDPGGALARAIPARNVVGGVVYSANEVIEPGVVRNFVPNNNMLVIGNANREDLPAVHALRAALEGCGVSSPPVPDVRVSVWAKLAQNIANSALCLLTEASVSEVAADPALAELGRRLREEALAIAAAHGIDVARAPQRPAGGHRSGAQGHKPSMLQDYLLGRPLEIEAQLRAPLEYARARGVAVPVLEMLVPLAAHKAMAKGLYQPYGTHP
ncbi:MAG TPA: 2-dehydropantoate 2-reductase [Burkholderiales bacterium]|nr:2-dehydropantoate 2-reductase [Burkholderiales bacterium]